MSINYINLDLVFQYRISARFHTLKYGTECAVQGVTTPSSYEETGPCGSLEGDGDADEGIDHNIMSVTNVSWRQGRQLLRQYLQEIGYTDTIIDVRSNRVRSLLGLNNNTESEDMNTPALNGGKKMEVLQS